MAVGNGAGAKEGDVQHAERAEGSQVIVLVWQPPANLQQARGT